MAFVTFNFLNVMRKTAYSAGNNVKRDLILSGFNWIIKSCSILLANVIFLHLNGTHTHTKQLSDSWGGGCSKTNECTAVPQ